MTKEENSVKVENAKPRQERSERERGRRGQKKEKQKPQTKIVIRHLPPTMSEEEFLEQIDPLPEHDFYYFAAADWSLGYDATCRAYISLKQYNDVYLFRDRFDGYVFVDSKGAEYPAIVEFAPFQGLLKNKSRRTDNKVNSIEQEPHYQQFLVKLEEDREAATKGGESKLEFSLDRKKEEKITSTPLLQYLANKKEKRREEAKKRTEEKRRQRDDEKEKRRHTQQQQQVTKIISGQDGGGGNRRDSGSKSGGGGAGGKENVSNDKGGKQPQEERKNSRSKRRAERDQRRREEHEQRKREREQKEKGISAKSEEKSGGSKAENSKNPELKSQESFEKPSEDFNQRKDSTKKRSRNRRGYSYDGGDNDKGKRSESAAGNLDDLKTELKKPPVSSNSNEVSESVVDFIRSVVTAKEFVPSKKLQQPVDTITAATEMESTIDEKTITEQTKKSSPFKARDDEIKKENTRSEKSNARDESRQARRERTAEERRIRNKDRPSIAIYQPKPRARVSEDSNVGGGSSRDARSNPTSDCESVKKDEQRHKKVSRYSERRLERKSANANRDKQQKASESDGGGGSGNETLDNSKSEHNRHELQKSKSYENECGAEAAAKIETVTNKNDSDTEN